MNFQAIMQNLVQNCNISKRELAEKSGITTRLLNYYLRGERKPTLDTADRLLKAMGETLIIGGTNNETSTKSNSPVPRDIRHGKA